MPREFFSFEIPISKSTYKNGSTLSRKIGDVVVSVDNDEEIISLMYGGVDILPVMERLTIKDIWGAIENHRLNRRIEMDIDEENQEAI